jgi:hypothetical protein
MNPLTLAQPVPIVSHHPLGASTGYMGELRGNWRAQVGLALTVSPFAVELSALSEGELDGLAAYLDSNPALPFRYLSIHGPSKGRRMSEAALVESLARLGDRVHAIVMHPDTIEDSRPFRKLGRKLVLENMDARKEDGRSVEELEAWFERLPDAAFCFDVAHAWSVDSDMRLASDLLDAFRTRLRHVHVSSLDAALHHVPLTEDDERLFMPLLHRCVDVPWILEAPPR